MFCLLKVDDDNTQTPPQAPLHHKLCLMSTEIINKLHISPLVREGCSAT